MAVTSATRFAHPVALAAWAASCLEARQRPSCFQAINVGHRLPSPGVVAAASGSLRLWSLSQPTAVSRSTGYGSVVAGTYNQSFERTRSAAASGCAGQHVWRAAQLRIRYTSG